MEDKLTPTAPARIWLQVDTNDDDRSLPFPEDAEGVSWWKEMVGGAEVEYVRADLVRAAMPINTTDEGDPELQRLAVAQAVADAVAAWNSCRSPMMAQAAMLKIASAVTATAA